MNKNVTYGNKLIATMGYNLIGQLVCHSERREESRRFKTYHLFIQLFAFSLEGYCFLS
jgi:hypothetical protein